MTVGACRKSYSIYKTLEIFDILQSIVYGVYLKYLMEDINTQHRLRSDRPWVLNKRDIYLELDVVIDKIPCHILYPNSV